MPKEYGTALEAEDGREVLLNSSTQEGNRVVDVIAKRNHQWLPVTVQSMLGDEAEW